MVVGLRAQTLTHGALNRDLELLRVHGAAEFPGLDARLGYHVLRDLVDLLIKLHELIGRHGDRRIHGQRFYELFARFFRGNDVDIRVLIFVSGMLLLLGIFPCFVERAQEFVTDIYVHLAGRLLAIDEIRPATLLRFMTVTRRFGRVDIGNRVAFTSRCVWRGGS